MTPFQQFIQSCSDSELARLKAGSLAISCNDNIYQTATNGINIATLSCASNATTPELITQDIKQYLNLNEAAILNALYQTRPLCQDEFNFQAQQLFARYGAENFCHHLNNLSHKSLMIDQASLISVNKNDARSQYGYYCECNKKLSTTEAKQTTLQWLLSAQAYEDYREKTYCRYTCL